MATADPIMSPSIRVVAPKPRMTIYFALLILALIAMLAACLFMYLEIRRFGGFGAVSGRVTSLDRPAVFFNHGVHEVHGVDAVKLSSVNSVSSVV
jgi:hypothetical protein